MKRTLFLFISLLLAVLFSLPTTAIEPYDGYTYDEWNKGIPATNGYEAEFIYSGDVGNNVFLNSPSDLFIDEQGRIFILNSGNKSLLMLENDFTFIREISEFKDSNGSTVYLNDPRSVFVSENKVYIADYEQQCIIISDLLGNIEHIIAKPENPVFPQEKEFRPFAVVVDGQKNIYALSLDIYQGAVVFNEEYEFKDFFGGNLVSPTFDILMDRFWQSIMTKEQDDAFSNYVPVLPSNIDVTAEGFLYTSSNKSEYDDSNIRCISPAGAELWSLYGDKEFGVRKFQSYVTEFIDVAVFDNNYVCAIDSTLSRIFVFDTEQNTIFTFGGNSSQKGNFAQPKAIDTFGKKIYVLDASKANVTVFAPTEYGDAVLDALALYEDGKYDESRKGWEEVLKMNGNEALAYNGIGKALLYSGEYREAQDYFKMASNREDESRAYELYRTKLMRKYSPVTVVVLIAFAILLFAVFIIRKIKNKRGCR